MHLKLVVFMFLLSWSLCDVESHSLRERVNRFFHRVKCFFRRDHNHDENEISLNRGNVVNVTLTTTKMQETTSATTIASSTTEQSTTPTATGNLDFLTVALIINVSTWFEMGFAPCLF